MNDERNSPVGRIQGLVGLAQFLVRVPTYLHDLVLLHTILLDKPAGGVGAVGGEFPVPVSARVGVGLRVRVALNGKLVRQLSQLLR